MLNEFVKPGNLVEVISRELNEREDKKAKTMKTRIYDIASEDVIRVTVPTVQGKMQLIAMDREYDIYFYTDNGLFQSICTVKDRYRINAVPVMELEIQSNLRRYQRREYYRLNCLMEMKCRALNSEETDEFIKTGNYSTETVRVPNAVLVDISGGGARFVTNEQYEIGALTLFRFSLRQKTGYKDYSVIARIIHSDPMQKSPGKFENRAEFVDIENAERESIIKYIFEEERRMRKTTTSV